MILLRILLAIAAGAFAQAKPDLSNVTEEDIRRTVIHLRMMLKESDAEVEKAKKENAGLMERASSLVVELGNARVANELLKSEVETIQGEFDAMHGKLASLKRDVAKLEVERDRWRKRANALMVSIGVLVSLWVFSLLPVLIPVYYRLAAGLAAGATTYGALYAIL